MSHSSLFVIPNELLQFLNPTVASPLPTFLRLPHPRTGLNALFLVIPSRSDPEKEILLEIQVVDPDAGRSWMFNETVSSNGKLYMTTPIDPAFIMAPLLKRHAAGRQTLQESDSLLDALASNAELVNPKHERDFRKFISCNLAPACLSRVCEKKAIAAAGVVTYCYSEEVWLGYLRKKVGHLGELVTSESFPVLERGFSKDGLLDEGREDLLKLARMKAAINMISHYLPEDVQNLLLSRVDLSGLEEYESRLREEEAALLAAQAPKKSKTKGGDATKRKAANQISRGVDKLKKVNTVGMTKLSSFFQKAAKE